MMVWAFGAADVAKERELIFQSVKSGKSRFGWSGTDKHNLKLENNWTKDHSAQLFLLEIKPGDWIVHINTPKWGWCTAAKVKTEYGFDEGIECERRRDFRHCFSVDVDSVIKFERNDPNVLPTVNLKPRGRYHRVYAIGDFLESIENLKENHVKLGDKESREEYFLKEKLRKHLSETSKIIHSTHKGKSLEGFLAKVFRKIPGVTGVIENGAGWGTDHGADLIVTTSTLLGSLDIENKIVVQIKSFEGVHYDTEAVAQVKHAIEKFSASAGFIITTAEKSEQLEREVQEASNEIQCPIVLLASEDVAKFVIKYAPELLFELEALS